MTDKVPIRTVFDSSGNATGLAEFQSGETVGHIHGGTGLSSLGSAGQVLRVNGAGNAIEFGDGFSTSSGDITLDSAADIILDADGADIILKDGGTEFGRFTNSSGQLVIKSSSSSTTAMTMSGANVTIAGNLTVTGTTDGDGNIILGDAATDTVSFGGTITGSLTFEGSTDDSFETTLTPGNPSSDITLTLPSSGSDTLVGKATTDTLTNKSIDLANNTLTGSLAEFNSALQSESFVSLTGSETLTNKTLTSPTINSGTLATPSITGNTSTTGSIIFEGSTADSFETTLAVTDPTADRTVSLPNATTTLVGTDTSDTLTNKTLTTPIIAEIDSGSTITLDATTDINLDADGGDVILKDGGTEFGRFTQSGGELVIKSGSSSTTNLTMSGANITAAGNLTVTGTTTFNGGTITLGDAATDTVAFNGTISTNLIFEGSTADSFETTVAPANPSSDITVTLPSKTGTVATITDVNFSNSTITTHPAADGNFDMAQSETPFTSVTDAFAIAIGDIYDQMDPRGSIVTVDLGSVA